VKPAYWDDAARELGRRDPVLKRVIRDHPGVHLQRRGDPFTTLARAIVGQQISVQAAQTIWDRVVAATGAAGSAPRLDPVLRPEPGFLTPEAWQASLRAASFAAPEVFPDVPRIRDVYPAFFVGALGAWRP